MKFPIKLIYFYVWKPKKKNKNKNKTKQKKIPTWMKNFKNLSYHID